MTNREPSGWLQAVLVSAQDARWCMETFCTLCGSMEFRRAYWAAAARQSNMASRFESARWPRDFLEGVSRAERGVLVRTLVAGLRELPPVWTDSKAFRIIIMNLYPEFIDHGLPMALDTALAGTPAAEAFGRMRAHAEEARVRREFEGPQAVEERRRADRETRAAAHARRQSENRQRDIERLELLAALARLSQAERLSRFATDPALNLDCVSTELIPAQERHLIDIDKSHAIALITRIGRRKGAWGRLSRMLAHHVNDEPELRMSQADKKPAGADGQGAS